MVCWDCFEVYSSMGRRIQSSLLNFVHFDLLSSTNSMASLPFFPALLNSTNIICPWFTDTGIIAPLTRVAILGLPLCEVDDVVASVIKCSSDESFTGNTISVDAKYIVPSLIFLLGFFWVRKERTDTFFFEHIN
jgi:hypothetical protein